MSQKVKIVSYTKGEEIFNFVSHVAAGGICVLGTALLIVLAALTGDALAVVSWTELDSPFSLAMMYILTNRLNILQSFSPI